MPLLLVLSFVPVVNCLAETASQDSLPPTVAGGKIYADAPSFAAELQRIGNAIKQEKASAANMAALREKLPSQWELAAAERHYSLSAEPLRALLREAEKEKKPENRAAKVTEAAEWVFDLANQVHAFGGVQTHSALGARPTLERILNRREFGSVHGPTAWDLFRQRINHWIENLLMRFFRQIGRYPIGAKILYWGIVIAVVVWLAVALFRYWTKRAAREELQTPDAVAFVRTWQEWIRTAREAATRGDFRKAVHSTYWAGISYLEDSGVVKKDRARTPREYLRSVSHATELAASGRRTREALAALTIALEQVWYGRRPASNQDFTNAIESVEALGCQLR